MFVILVAPRSRRSAPDPASGLLAALRVLSPGGGPDVVTWDRAVGGSLAGVTASACSVIRATRVIVRARAWNVGIGAGALAEPLPDVIAEIEGDAVGRAQDALARAGRGRARLTVAVAGANRIAAADAEALFTILAHQWSTRSEAGWQAVAAVGGLEDGGAKPQHLAAQELGITQQALSQRLRAAGWAAEQGILPLLRRRLNAAGGDEGPGGSA